MTAPRVATKLTGFGKLEPKVPVAAVRRHRAFRATREKNFCLERTRHIQVELRPHCHVTSIATPR